MDFKLTKEQQERRKEFFEVCEKLEKKKPEGFSGLEAIYDTDKGWEYHLYCAKEFAKRGWLALGWPPDYGGQGTLMDVSFFQEALGYYDVPGRDIFGVGMLAPTLLMVGNEEQKEKWLPKIAAGDIMWCQLWSEPDAGSDLAALTTTAEREGDHYVINGQKTWSTGAHRADWAFGLFKTDLEGRKRHNLSFMLLDMDVPGVTVNPIEYMDKGHLYNEVFLDNVSVPAENLIGDENKGWEVTRVTMGWERSGLGVIMGLKRALEDIVKYCNETKVNGKPLAKDPIIRNRIAEIACEIEAGRALAYKVVDQQEKGQVGFFQPSAVKVFSGGTLRRMAHLQADILGPYAQVRSSKWAPLEGAVERAYQQLFVITVSMGTNEIQRNIIAWYGLGLPRMYLKTKEELEELKKQKGG